MVRWSFERAGLCLNPSDLLGAVTVDATPILERTDVPKHPFDDAFVYPERFHCEQLQRSEHRGRQRIPEPTEFAINLIAGVDTTIGKCPLCGYEESEETSLDEEESNH
jgi:hypothetical protein